MHQESTSRSLNLISFLWKWNKRGINCVFQVEWPTFRLPLTHHTGLWKISLQVSVCPITSALPSVPKYRLWRIHLRGVSEQKEEASGPGCQGSLKCLSYRVKFPGFFLCPALKGTVRLAEFPLCSPHCVSPKNRNTGSLMMFSSLLKDYVVIEWPYQRPMLHNTVTELT